MPTRHSPAEILAHLLVRVGLVTAPDSNGNTTGDWPVAANVERPEPDATVTIYDSEGGAWFERDFTGDVSGPQPIQVRVAAATNRIARLKAWAIYEYLSKTLEHQFATVESQYYDVQCCSNFGNLITLGKETPDSKRNVVVFNTQVTVVDRTP